MVINVVLNKQRVRRDGKCQVVMYVSLKGRARHSFNIHVPPDRWDDKLRRVKPGGNGAEFNRKIMDAIGRAELLALQDGMTARRIVQTLAGASHTGKDFYTVARERLEQLGKKVGHNTRRQKLSALSIIERIAPGLSLEELDAAALERIEVKLLETRSRNTTTYKLKRLQAMWNDANRHFKLRLPDPFEEVSMKTTPTLKKGLFPDQMDRVRSVDLSGMSRIVRLARDTIILQYLFCGMRWADVARGHEDWFMDGRLVYQMHKTTTIIQWPVHPDAQAIMDRWAGECARDHEGRRFILPFLKEGMGGEDKATYDRVDYMNKEVNKALKVVAQLAGVPAFGTHWARHSNNVKAVLSGVGNRALQDMNGHKASRTTDGYVKQLVGTMDLDSYKKMYGG